MPYRIEFRPAAQRELAALPQRIREHVGAANAGLAANPRPFGVKKLRGAQNVYRIKAGPGKQYRVLYQIRDEVLLVLVVSVGHRKDVYR